MAFFSRPNLDDIQFKQLSGTSITLSGETKIATVTGLTLSDGVGGYRPIVGAGGNLGDVLTLAPDGSTICLMQPTGSGGTGVYYGSSPTTCTVGGLNTGSVIYGCTFQDILQDILVPTLDPNLENPWYSFSIDPPNTIYEVGTQVIIAGSSSFNRGTVSPVYSGGTSVRTGPTTAFCYINFNSVPTTCSTTAITNSISFGNRIILPGASNTVCGKVYYSAGEYPLDSDGNTTLSCCPAGAIPSSGYYGRTICGIYPYFWGKTVGTVGGVPQPKPTANQSLLSGGTKVVSVSTGDITINYSAEAEYIWLAVPAMISNKNCWVGSNNPMNSGSIPSSLFSYPTSDKNITINSPEGCWNNTNYNFYISETPTSTIDGGSPYTITFKRV